MKIAVLMSAYNGEKYIRQQIESILNQKGTFDLELIVRDDGSSDSTCDILKKYEADGKLQWYTGDNLKPAQSFLRLLAQAPDSEFYAFADQDDYWMPDKLKRAVEAIGDCKDIPMIYYANSELVDSDLNSLHMNVYNGPQYPSLLMTLCSSNIMGCSMVFNKRLRDLFLKRSVEKLDIGMHDYFIAQLCNMCGGEIVYDDHVVMKYRQHGRNAVGYGKIEGESKLRSMIHKVTKKPKITIDRNAKNLLLYEKYADDKGLKMVRKVCRYRESVLTRLELSGRLLAKFLIKRGTKHEALAAIRVFLGIA